MRWPDVLLGVAGVAKVDSVLVPIYGNAIRLQGADAHTVPSLDLLLVSDQETELWEPIVIQWSQWTTSLDDLIASERRLRDLFVHEFATDVGGVTVFSEFLDGVALESPTRDNVHGRAIRIALEPLRSGLQR